MRTDVLKAASIAAIAHDTQTDMAGKSYFYHCQRVADNVEAWYESEAAAHITEPMLDDLLAVAYLHDVVEDTNWTLTDLKRLGKFNQAVLGGVEAMTQRWVPLPEMIEEHGWQPTTFYHQDSMPGCLQREPLEEYWARVKANPIARIVKMYGDIPDNNDPKRKAYLPQAKQDKLTDKYARALEFLGDNDGR